jgi:hypothetical protein
MQIAGILAWVAQGRCGSCHVRLGDAGGCPRCGSSWRAGCGDDDIPWIQERSWMRCATLFIHGGAADIALDLLGMSACRPWS